MPRLSVIVPVYKAEQYLQQCVESILGQSFADLELLLIDDGSPDGSGAMCDRFAAQDPRVRVIHKENGGVSTARNAGLDAATGDYIAFVDSDDYLDSCMYEKMMAEADRGVDLVMCDCVKEFPDRSVLYTHNIRGGDYSREQLEKEYFPHLLIMENVEYPATISNWLLVFRRELAKELRYPVGVRFSEDLLFGARVLYAARSFCYLKGQGCYHYRMNPQSATHRFVPDKWEDYRRLHNAMVDAFGDSEIFDFSRQIDLCLLFFIYNAVGDILGADLPRAEKKAMIGRILRDRKSRDMFRRLNIGALPIPAKQKVITLLYKKIWAIGLLCAYFERK